MAFSELLLALCVDLFISGLSRSVVRPSLCVLLHDPSYILDSLFVS